MDDAVRVLGDELRIVGHDDHHAPPSAISHDCAPISTSWR